MLAIAQWIRLRLLSCVPGLNPKHTIYASTICSHYLSLRWEEDENKQKGAGFGPLKTI